MTSKHRKRLKEQARWLENQEREHNQAVGRAAAQHQPVPGMRPVSLPGLAADLDRIDPRMPHPGPRRPEPAFVPPRFVPDFARANGHGPNRSDNLVDVIIEFEGGEPQERAMENFRSSESVSPTTGGVRSQDKSRAPVRLKIPADVVTALGRDRLMMMTFAVELTEDGLLFRPGEIRSGSYALPAWAQDGKAKVR